MDFCSLTARQVFYGRGRIVVVDVEYVFARLNGTGMVVVAHATHGKTMTALLYIPLILFLIRLLRKHSPFQPARLDTQTAFSIIIPFRNEKENIPRLIESLEKLDYPHDRFEVIFVDDDSDDGSAERIRKQKASFRHRILKSSGALPSPKKAALDTGIRAAEFPYIHTLDADVRVHPLHLQYLSAFIREHENPDLVAAPVLTEPAPTNAHARVQQYEFLALTALTRAGFLLNRPFSANGANLSFSAEAFRKAGGWKNGIDYAGGDDLFLLANIRKLPGARTAFLASPHAAVYVPPLKTRRNWLNQHLRWAYKSVGKRFNAGSALAVLQTLTYAEILWRLLSASPPFFSAAGWIAATGVVTVHYYLLKTAARNCGYPFSFKSFLTAQFLLPFYYVSLGMTLLGHAAGIKKHFKWKGRTYKK